MTGEEIEQSASERDTEDQDGWDESDATLTDLFEKYRARGRAWTGPARRRPYRDPNAAPSDDLPGATDEVTESDEEAAAWEPGPGIYRSKTGTGPSKYDPRLVGSVLDQEIGKRGWKQPIAVGSIVGRWEEIVGDLVAERCPVESFEGGKLVVRASSTAWAQQMQLLLPQIMARIDEVVGPQVVEQVIVRPPRAPKWTHGKYRVPGRGPRDTYG